MRKQLPNRRPHIIESFTYNGLTYHGCLGVYPDTGEPGDVWLNAGKAGSHVELNARASGIAASHALQHGCDYNTLRHSLPKLNNGKPADSLGTFLSLVADATNA